MLVDRRSLLVTGTLGIGAFAVPGFARSPNVTQATGFTHSVASGEPGSDTMLLWTRYVPADGGEARVRVEVSETPDFTRITAGGETVTGAWRDHTAKITIDGLAPATRYFYRFVAPDGTFSPVGRTRTFPDDAKRFTMAVFSCSNIGFGFFNAYAHAAARDDIDLVVHLGDYFYEHAPNVYPVEAEVVAGRLPAPDHEIVALADYRLRYASYRRDPALAALHAAKPMIAQWDDHEFCNDPWEGGAQAHQPDEGPWSTRKAAAMQAWYEWMPVTDRPWSGYDIGGLASLFRTETRVLARSRQLTDHQLLTAADPMALLHDPARTMMGSAQESWLAHALAASVKSGRRWQLVGSGTLVGQLALPLDAGGWIAPDAPGWSRNGMESRLKAARAGLPLYLDTWSGYPAARARLLASAEAADANLIVLSGDSHNAWAFDLANEGRAAGVEFGGTSVTSHGLESSTSADPTRTARDLVAANRELAWCDTSRRGYMAVTLTPDTATSDWVMVDTVMQPSLAATIAHRATVPHGRRAMA